MLRRTFLKALAILPFVRLPARPEPEPEPEPEPKQTVVPGNVYEIPIVDIITDGRSRLRSRLEPGAVDWLKSSMEYYGQIQPLVAYQDLTLVDGLHRLEAAKRLGWETISVYIKPRSVTIACVKPSHTGWELDSGGGVHTRYSDGSYRFLMR